MSATAQHPRPPLLRKERAICAWVGQAHPGDSRVYHDGSLARDRSSTESTLPAPEREELSRVARRALALAQAGLVDLTQRRLGPADYEYRITVRRRPRRDDRVLADVLAAELPIEGGQE